VPLTLIDDDACDLSDDEVAALEKKARASFVTSFDDHGLTWKRTAGREWAQGLGGHSLWVAPGDGSLEVEGSGAGGGFGFMVVRDVAMKIVRSGTAPTRAEARKHAVFALAIVLGMPLTPKVEDLVEPSIGDEDISPRFSFPMRIAIGWVGVVVVAGIAALFLRSVAMMVAP